MVGNKLLAQTEVITQRKKAGELIELMVRRPFHVRNRKKFLKTYILTFSDYDVLFTETSSVLLVSVPNLPLSPPQQAFSDDILLSRKKAVLPTKQVVSGQGIEDARGSDEVAHGSGESGGINPDGDKGVPDVDVSQETVIPLKQDTVKVWRTKFKRLF